MEELLIEIGLTNEEAKTYLASLSLGPTTIYLISQKSGLPRSTTYLIIDQLKLKGLMSVATFGKKTIYTPAPPNKLLEVLNEKENSIQKMQSKLSQNLFQLNSMFNKMPQKPKVFFYEGLEGLKNIFNDTLSAKEILVYCSGYDKPMEKKINEFQEEYFKKCDQKKIKTYELIGGGLDSKEYLKKYQGALHQIRIFPFKRGLEHIDKMIYGNKLAIISYVYLNGVVIENQPIVEFEKELFWKLWNK